MTIYQACYECLGLEEIGRVKPAAVACCGKAVYDAMHDFHEKRARCCWGIQEDQPDHEVPRFRAGGIWFYHLPYPGWHGTANKGGKEVVIKLWQFLWKELQGGVDGFLT